MSSLFAVLVTWTIFAAIPYFRFNGPFPQVDTQIIFLHFLCGIMFFYFAVNVLNSKFKTDFLSHPLISFSFLLALISLISSLFSNNFNISASGSPQIGQGVFWYFDLTIMSIIFSQITNLKKIRIIIFVNLLIVTTLVSLFTFFPNWKGIPISFYYFTDYLCFYGVLTFILFTSITKNFFFHLLGFLLLGLYFTFLENRSAILFWCTTFTAAAIFYCFQLFKQNNITKKIKSILFSDLIFVFVIIFISFLIVSSSIYFWPEDYSLPSNIKGTLLDAPVVRGKIFETSLYSLNSLKDLLVGNGWGLVPDLLLENMNPWQYDELRQGYNLHFHTHNEIAEHLVSVGLVGSLLFIIYIYFIFKFSGELNFHTKLGWLLFFKINCFWFMWVGTFAAFAVVVSSLIFQSKKIDHKQSFLNFTFQFMYKKSVISFLSICSGCFILYGSYVTYKSIKVNSLLNYTAIMQYLDNKKYTDDKKCLSYYNDLDRGGFMLDIFLSGYTSHLFNIESDKVDDKDLKFLEELKCKADDLIKTNNFTSSLLSTAIKVDADYYYKFGKNLEKQNLANRNYQNWLYKANILSEKMPDRGDLLLPFLSYAISNNKNNDALNICKKNITGLEAFCYLIEANSLLSNNNLSESNLQNSIDLIKKSIKLGLFNELVYGFWFQKCNVSNKEFCGHGNKGIPLSPDIIFLISDQEKLELEKLITEQ